MDALEGNKTWELVTLAVGKKAISSRTVISIATSKNWFLYQMDVNNAFLQGDLYEKLTTVLLEAGYCQSPHDHSLFTKKQEGNIVIILIYVDDILITGSCKDLIDEAKQTLYNNFKVKDLGELKYFLGIEVLRSQKGILLNQKKYALELVLNVGLSGAKPVSTPLEANTKLTTTEYDSLTGCTYDPLLEDINSYQKLVGKLIYLTITRPNIYFTIQVLSQFMQQPKRSYWDATLRVIRYIKGCPGLGISMSENSTTQLTAFCDADWAACPNTRRSGYAI
ncbi:uncharacterized mitochondrial protein AtMg00810-like [Nicotiana tomentosiformis]|uniref:uncharacterized mitochondrial protein AtMg00810-like n=1 Tax=Nicotiana tomentosiformis TaxID=4098 RepID=UPI00388CB72A